MYSHTHAHSYPNIYTHIHIHAGQGYAVSSKGGVGLEGRHLYELKEKIDRDWMAMYTQLPVMDMAGGSRDERGAAQVSMYTYVQ
ncbi:hypothetical protein EON64_11240, partial [archaeon]